MTKEEKIRRFEEMNKEVVPGADCVRRIFPHGDVSGGRTGKRKSD